MNVVFVDFEIEEKYKKNPHFLIQLFSIIFSNIAKRVVKVYKVIWMSSLNLYTICDGANSCYKPQI